MGDFFSRLAERTLGLVPVVKPDLMPVFMAAPESAAAHDSITRAEEKAVRMGAPTKTASLRDADSISPSMTTAEFENVDGNSPRSTAQSWDQAVTVPGPDGRVVDGQLKTANREPSTVESQVAHEQQEVVEIERNKGSRQFITSEGISLAEIHERIYATPAIAPSKSSETIRTAAPAIQISIGRVEVRASVQPASAPRVVERKAPPRLSLEEYLRERNEGRR
jgi:hypothetical protein